MENKYSLIFHFVNSTITINYDEEEDRENAFKVILSSIETGSQYYMQNDTTLINLNQILCITKGEPEAWKSERSH